MRTFRIDYRNLVRQLLPAHKRQPVRLWWLRRLTAPLAGLFTDFETWRDDTRILMNVTFQVRVFEGYLRKKYGQPVAIRVETYEDGGLRICLEEEGDTQRLDLALEAEGTPAAEIPLEGELREQFGDVDVVIYIPQGVDIEQVVADVERFKQALVKYKIIQK